MAITLYSVLLALATFAVEVAALPVHSHVVPHIAPKPHGFRQPTLTSLRTGASSCDASIPGKWTGYIQGKALFDVYQLQWRGLPYEQGAFTALYVTRPSWTFGVGQLSADNTTLTLNLDGRMILHGNISDDCNTFSWDNGSQWRKTTLLPKSVHMISMNHLDVGYNGIPTVGLINNVLNMYFNVHFPRALAMIQALKARGGSEQYIYTTHPWLLDMYLHCPSNFTLANVVLNCPSAADVTAMRAAVKAGDVVFHASPFNIQFGGAFSQAMIDTQMTLAKRLADELGVPRPRVASLRDVPGAPRSLIPALERNGIEVLSIGVNNYAPRPQLCVPNGTNYSVPCVWMEPATGARVTLLMTDQGVGYPDNPGPNPAEAGGLLNYTCVNHNDSPAVLCWYFRTDNSGPPDSIDEVLGVYDTVRWQWPGSVVRASTYEAWWDEFKSMVPQLPVETREMGETWLTGFAADPFKNAWYRMAARQYQACVDAGACDPDVDPRLTDFLRLLMKLPEHTWGLPTLNDRGNYTNAQFYAARSLRWSNYMDAEASWSEQRAIAPLALAALKDHPLADAIRSAAADLKPSWPSPTNAGLFPVTDPASLRAVRLTGGGTVTFTLDASTGAFSTLTLPRLGAIADASHPMGLLSYQVVNDTEINTTHITVAGHSCCCCYGWDHMDDIAKPIAGRYAPSLRQMYASSTGAAFVAPATFLVEVGFDAQFSTNYGAPMSVWYNYTVHTDGAITIDVSLFNKTSTRLEEAIYFDFSAIPRADESVWLAEVLGHWVDPRDVVERGSQHQHGIGEAVAQLNTATGEGVAVYSVDAPVVSPFSPSVPPSTLIVPFHPLTESITGFSVVLFSNIYNTNFPLYSTCDDGVWPHCDYKFRFRIAGLLPSAERAAAATAALVH